MQTGMGELMGENVEEVANEEEFTQGGVLLGVIVNGGLDNAVTGYLHAAEGLLTALVNAAEGLIEDGVSLEDFVALLRGGDIS